MLQTKSFLLIQTLMISQTPAFSYRCFFQNNYIHRKKISSVVQYFQYDFLPYNLPFYL